MVKSRLKTLLCSAIGPRAKTATIYLLLAAFFFSAATVPAQLFQFSTIAGSVNVIGGNDGTNGAASFNFPSGIAIDDAGNIFVADLLNHMIRKVSPQGTNWIITTIAGAAGLHGWADGSNSVARFDHPIGLAVDHLGNVFVADKYNDCIRKITPIGTNWAVTTIAGAPGVQSDENGTNSNAHFWGPSGVCIASDGSLFVVDSSNFTIRHIVQYGTNWAVSTIAGTPLLFGFQDGLNEAAEFDYPYSVSATPSGELYVTDWGNQSIRQISTVPGGWYTATIAGFTGDFGTNDGPGQTASFNSPTGIALDASGNIFVTDYASQTIRKVFITNGNWFVTTIGGAALQSGSRDDIGTNARFFRPWGIAFDRAGNMFVADYRNQTIRKGTLVLPVLQIAQVPGKVTITWPVALTNYILETRTSFAAASTWTEVTSGLTTVGLNNVFTNATGSATAFFRLHYTSGGGQ